MPPEQTPAEHGLRCAADVEFGKAQARDLLQHLWTGPISNAPVDIVQGSKSVEVRPVGVSKVRFLFFPLYKRHCLRTIGLAT